MGKRGRKRKIRGNHSAMTLLEVFNALTGGAEFLSFATILGGIEFAGRREREKEGEGRRGREGEI